MGGGTSKAGAAEADAPSQEARAPAATSPSADANAGGPTSKTTTIISSATAAISNDGGASDAKKHGETWPEKRGRGVAKFAFEANDKYQMSLKVGDEVEVLEVSPEGGWYRGILVKSRARGIFPVNYIELGGTAATSRTTTNSNSESPATVAMTAASATDGVARTPGPLAHLSSRRAPSQAFLDEALRSGKVIPCQLAGCYAPDRFYANAASGFGKKGFCDGASYKKYHGDNRAKLARYDGWGDVELDCGVDPAWATAHGNVGGFGFCLGHVKPKLLVLQKEMVGAYEVPTAAVQAAEPGPFQALVDFPFAPPEGTKNVQDLACKDDMKRLYGGALEAIPELWDIAVAVGEAGGAAVDTRWNIKTPVRVFDKARQKPALGFARITDIARASVVFSSCEGLEKALRHLVQRHGRAITRFKNRFAKPCFGYRDFLVNFRASNGHVCEQQFHLKAIMDAKSGTGHAAYGWLRMLRTAGGDATKAKDAYVGEKDAKGKKHGKGRETFATGIVYEGEYEHGWMTGKGRMTYPSGGVFEGEYKRLKQQGFGRSTAASGAVREGRYKDGRAEGKCRYTYANGDVHEGVCKNGKWEGKGRMTYASGDVFNGEYKGGKKEGKGRYTQSNGDVYDGDFKGGKKEGNGRFTWQASGNVYEGEYQGGKRGGKGRYTYASGKVKHEGGWKDGEYVHDAGEFATLVADVAAVVEGVAAVSERVARVVADVTAIVADVAELVATKSKK